MFRKILILCAAVLGVGVVYSQIGNIHVPFRHRNVQMLLEKQTSKDGELCNMPSMHLVATKTGAGAAKTTIQQGSQTQNPPNQDNSFDDFVPAQAPESDKYCERPSAKDPNVGETDPNKIGCKCARKCENGKPTENYEEGKRCSVHCKPDHCACPDPCTKT